MSSENVTLILLALLSAPLLGTLMPWLTVQSKSKTALYSIHAFFSVVTSVIGFIAISKVINGSTYTVLDHQLLLDPISGVFLTIISITGLLVNLYSIKYMDWELNDGRIKFNDAVLFFSLSQLFVFTMTLSVVVNNILLLWAAIEATTLSSVFLVALYRNKRATEGGWKYVVLCSMGLSFALYGTVLLYGLAFSSTGDAFHAMLWTSLMKNAKLFNPNVMKIIFVLAVFGYGTKAGLFPNHFWLPDTHSEAPCPASAMLSAVLLKCAIAAIVRFYAIAGNSPLGFGFPSSVLLVLGLLSVLVSSLFILKQTDIKRMFAYHSIENIGIIAFGLGLGSPLGVFAALFHALNHSLTKAIAFCTTGNLYEFYGTRDMRKMGGLIRIAPVTTFLLAVAIFSLAGTPPLAMFTSEFLTVKAGLGVGDYLAVALLLIGLAIVFAGLISHLNEVVLGKPRTELIKNKEVELSANLPLLVMAFLVLTIGWLTPNWWIHLLQEAVKTIGFQI